MTRIAILPGGLQSEPTCDLLVTCLGYESRCVFFAQRAVNGSRSRIALQFQQRLAGSYDANKQFYQESGFALIPFIEQGFGSAFRHVAGAALLGHAERPHVIVDVSSMSRPMIATAVLQVRELAR